MWCKKKEVKMKEAKIAKAEEKRRNRKRELLGQGQRRLGECQNCGTSTVRSRIACIHCLRHHALVA
jgi:uncharacterized OB-fold protein